MIEFKKQKTPLLGEIKVQGDEDISYFSLILSSLASGRNKIYGLLESKNVFNLMDNLRMFGIQFEKHGEYWIVKGVGQEGFREPINFVDCRNSKDILYLLIGLLSSFDFKLFFRVDDSLSNTNLEEIFDIFSQLGVSFNGRNDKNLPFMMVGNTGKKPLSHEIKDYTSVMKNVLLLSAINGIIENTIIEREKTRNHLEVLMKYLGLDLKEKNIGGAGDFATKVGTEISLRGGQAFSGKDIIVPSDTSFSAFISALALLIPKSDIVLKGVLMNQHRDAFYRTLVDMGANIKFINQKIICGEKVCDLDVKYGKLRDTVIPTDRTYKMLEEFPILILISSISKASLEIKGIKNVKEELGDDYGCILEIIKCLGVEFEETADTVRINGGLNKIDSKIIISSSIKNPNTILAMAVFGFFINNPIVVDPSIEDRYPDLVKFMQNLKLNVKLL